MFVYCFVVVYMLLAKCCGKMPCEKSSLDAFSVVQRSYLKFQYGTVWE